MVKGKEEKSIYMQLHLNKLSDGLNFFNQKCEENEYVYMRCLSQAYLKVKMKYIPAQAVMRNG